MPTDEQRRKWREAKRDYRLRTRGPARKPKPCGTAAAYRRHKWNGETPCEPCRLAYNAEKARLRRRKANR